MQNYLKQAIASLRSQPLVSWVSVAGTALAIFLIMVTVMMEEIRVTPFAPESNRDRWLVQRFTSLTNTNWEDGETNSGMSHRLVKAVFYEMETPEAVTALTINPLEALVSESSGKAFGAQTLDVDAGFWKVMDFTFISGSPFDRAEFDAASQVAVISESTARRLFGTSDAAGREFSVNHKQYRVKGVVRDVSTLATDAYADIWVPYTTTQAINNNWNEFMGSLKVIILPRSKEEITAVREEYNRLFARLHDESREAGWKFIMRGRPYDQETSANTQWANLDPDMESVRKSRYILWTILLLVPAVNLSSMTHSRLSKRREEIGVRRAFGARRSQILADLFVESLLITVMAGLLGLAASTLLAIFGSEMLLASSSVTGEVSALTPGMLLSWHTFGLAMLFCLILNILSSSLPAWQASRTNVVNALAGKK
ncbi:MAG: ABC transporter permease [Duncaniella sp.]|nr:ABC transporter permease [Duncaniella sp.]MDE5734130.1 ABC transporter permease [Duncaniella sp.]